MVLFQAHGAPVDLGQRGRHLIWLDRNRSGRDHLSVSEDGVVVASGRFDQLELGASTELKPSFPIAWRSLPDCVHAAIM
jgi:hypothetical protein